jgi:hypothetical protein
MTAHIKHLEKISDDRQQEATLAMRKQTEQLTQFIKG